MIFRALFIVFIGIVSYHYIDPKPIGDIPFSKLTLNLILRNIFGLIIPFWCLMWFIDSPRREQNLNIEYNPYVLWGIFSVVVIILSGAYWLFFISPEFITSLFQWVKHRLFHVLLGLIVLTYFILFTGKILDQNIKSKYHLSWLIIVGTFILVGGFLWLLFTSISSNGALGIFFIWSISTRLFVKFTRKK